MDIVEWNDDPAVFIANALNPAEVTDVIFDVDNPKACTVVVPDYQLSLAIGKRGQNARLAAKLTGFEDRYQIGVRHGRIYAKLEEGAYIDEGEAVESQESTIEDNESHDEMIIASDMTADDYENMDFDKNKSRRDRDEKRKIPFTKILLFQGNDSQKKCCASPVRKKEPLRSIHPARCRVEERTSLSNQRKRN